MTDPLLIAKNDKIELLLLPQMANRHGLITGATGTGKTVTLQTLAEHFSRIGVPCFMSDVKGDLSGISQAGGNNAKVTERIAKLGLTDHQYRASPVTFWDAFGELGHPVRATISDMGPLLLSRMLELNETQAGVLNLVFKVADDNGLLLLDLKDLRAMLQFVGDHGKEYTTEYGNISVASVGAIQRGLLALESQGGERIFGEPMLNIEDLMQTERGQGIINVLAADRLMQAPKMYATLLLWLLTELYEKLPEVGDLDKPKLVFFFDEAHLLFTDAPDALVDKIEQVVRLIRSKAVGVYFVTQNPADVPDKVLGQLGNRVQHALRAFSPRDQKAVKAAAETLRDNDRLDEETTITELGVGEALVSFLDEKGRPNVVERAFVVPPEGQIGPITPAQRQALIQSSLVAGVYEKVIDRESAYEIVKARTEQAAVQAQAEAQAKVEAKAEAKQGGGFINDILLGTGRRQGMVEAMAKSTVRTIGTQVGRAILRGVMGSILGGRK
ncbi:MAG: ATP-binding protein [Hydrogenophilales bacterium CG03_land_8_20_14_0_80_62_28]|nr:MAG: ATP-binding protein [Hydrogenophilaceae bacterium CG1_02_62_390]PIV24515.1 MAG: ATP-binding protein [Hydrogenophilales bacterium CG03_land_8_20_14_0_80_62_28]PIW38889.1 MAG: ATP-binding protein [Hydrogenophilales bacterium CG15_BIG_FIL_POST_REV_8_21_14_020_62_31]PIW71650.1 MAG: ATP-binding protein [Hydrogenophilales bacterium CG12_big_fil_rev_8_21_14_0_65_61_21]PIX01570.1 MAG: ATP-binding protein [Hydrogenophilales bacterium CG_4_8_14_3_um_filter_62_83]PIY99116.1 MAG: ATP-binding prote